MVYQLPYIMAYEKYIKKDGKIYGPYLYHSRRIDGKVVSEYHGQKKLDPKKFLWIASLVFLIILGAYFIGQRNDKLTGYSVLDLNANYLEGQALSGEVKLSLQEGELIPASSSVIFENAGKKYEYQLKDLILEPTAEGGFFMEGKNISGSGEGFGIPGTREVYPEVQFILNIEKPDINDSDTVKITEVPGSVSAGNTFTYTLQEGEKAEIKLRSVKLESDSSQLSDDSVFLTTEGGIVSISTNYSETEEGFGSSYSGEKIKELTINLGGLGLLPEKGELKVGIFYEGEELISLGTIIGETEGETEASTPEVQIQTSETTTEEQIQTEQPPTQKTTPNTTTNETFNASDIIETKSFNITFPKLELTADEMAVLEREFGNISLEVKETKTKNGFMIVRYELREDTWVNYSYSSDLGNSTLNLFMQQDRVKWLKDLAQKYSA